jgi:stage III sporulation protein AG
MEIAEKLRKLLKGRKWAVFMTICGAAGLLLIMISSFLPDDKAENKESPDRQCRISEAEKYCTDTEARLESFLADIEGAGEVRVYLTVGSDERYVYATEGRYSRGDNKTEEEDRYVIVGGGSEKKALVETVKSPEITGAVIACHGGDSAQVRESIYKAVSAALDIPTSRIYVTKLR